MTRTLRVRLGHEETPIGLLRHEASGGRQSASFEYEASWLHAAERFAIDPALGLVAGPQYRRRPRDGSLFHGAIADTEPDGWGRRVILRDHAKRRAAARREGGAPEARALHDLDFLLAVDDASRVGALRFMDEQGLYQRAQEPGRRTAPPLVELARLAAASHAVERSTETDADLAYLRGRATSLGGLRPKCTVVDDDGRLAIGKFPSVSDERAVTKGEVLAMRLARRAGIQAAAARLVDSGGVAVAVIGRFDRTPDGLRIPYVSAATMLGVEEGDPEDHAYTEIVDALRSQGAAAQEDITELYRRVAFSIAINNVDDHLKNHGFLHAGRGLWRLAPAFDLNPFPHRARELKTWISEDAGPEASLDALRAASPYFRLASARRDEILGEVRRAVSSWREVGADLGMSRNELDAFEDAFEV